MVGSWLITGGCGFIGRALIHSILADRPNTCIRVLDDLSVGTREDLKQVCSFVEKNVNEMSNLKSVELVVGDIKNFETIKGCAVGIDCVVHLAASTGVTPSVKDPRLDMMNNVVGTFNLLEESRHSRVRRFIFASSGAPLGEVEPPIHEEMAPHPVSPYGASKLAGEAYCSAYYRTFGLETVCLRFGNVYGPFSNHKESVVTKFIKRAIEGKPLEIYGNGHQTRDFIYIEDLVSAIRRASQYTAIGGETFQIATNCETRIEELVQVLTNVLRGHGYTDVKVTNSEPRMGDVRRSYSDTSKAYRILGWQCRTGLQNGLEKTTQWLISSK